MCRHYNDQSLHVVRETTAVYPENHMKHILWGQNAELMLKQVVHTVTIVLNNKPENLFYIAIKMCFAMLHHGCLVYFVINVFEAQF
jgi:hypothetical protein